MAISVAPLTTTVMSAVDQEHAGTASGVNNAISRVAGLLAIAALGAVMFHAFAGSVARGLERTTIAPEVKTAVMDQSVRLGAIDLPRTAVARDRAVVRQIVDESFVHAFRLVVLIACSLACLSAACAWLFIGRRS